MAKKWYLCDDDEYMPEVIDRSHIDPFREHIDMIIAVDKKDDLVLLIRSQLNKIVEDFNTNGSRLAYYILFKCVHSSAINCAAALLEEESDLTQYFKIPGLNLLHEAAEVLSLKMTRYFLKLGMPADEKVAGIDTCGRKILLPIDFAVQSTRRRIFWTQEQSLHRLIFRLTGEGMEEPIETMNLLIGALSPSEAFEIICHYATEGRVIELASLLIASSHNWFRVDKLYMPSNDASSGYPMTLRQHVVKQIVMLAVEVCNLELIEGTELVDCREMQNSMLSILMLLEIFLRTGHEISWAARSAKYCYPATTKEVSKVLASFGFELTGEDASYLQEQLQLFDQLFSEVDNYFPARMPLLDSCERMSDLGLDETDPEYDNLLPLHEAIIKLRSDITTSQWKQKESIFKLIIMLCLPEMKERLKAIELFVQKVDKINALACVYAKEGKLIELAIVLMVAWEKTMEPIKLQVNGDSSERSMTFQQLIYSELAQAIDLEYRLIGRITEKEQELSKLCKQRKEAIMSALPLLGMFEKAGARLQAYYRSEKDMVQKEQVVEDVLDLLAKVGCKVKSKDVKIGDEVDRSMELLVVPMDEAVEELKNNAEITTISGYKRQDFTRSAYVLPCGFVEGAYGRPDDLRKFLLTRYPRECFYLSSGVQSFRAFWTSNSKAGYCTGFSRTLKIQNRDVRGNWLMQKFAAIKQLGSVALTVKRRIKFL